jgi:hypothetical protein
LTDGVRRVLQVAKVAAFRKQVWICVVGVAHSTRYDLANDQNELINQRPPYSFYADDQQRVQLVIGKNHFFDDVLGSSEYLGNCDKYDSCNLIATATATPSQHIDKANLEHTNHYENDGSNMVPVNLALQEQS